VLFIPKMVIDLLLVLVVLVLVFLPAAFAFHLAFVVHFVLSLLASILLELLILGHLARHEIVFSDLQTLIVDASLLLLKGL